jgi:two-component system response regulator HydG
VSEVVQAIARLNLETVPVIEEGCAHLRRTDIALLVVHLPTRGETDKLVNMLRSMSAARWPVSTLVIGEDYDADQALNLLRAGAADYLNRPLDLRRLSYLLDELTLRVRHTPRAARVDAARDNAIVDNLGLAESFLYAPSSAMARLLEQVRCVAPLDVTLLLGGETGTGKTRLARLIHALSPRKASPFLTVNCGALSPTLMESELFGHVRGSFTGADRDRQGKFSEAGAGTILLDDIDSLPLELQAKLLRVVEERVFEPVGSNRTVTVQSRLIVASNRSLEAEVAASRFRPDLYYRLNVVAFYLPALRERINMLPALANQFLAELAARHNRPIKEICPHALRILQEYDWPGNIRELRNVVERAVVLCLGNRLEVQDIPDSIRAHQHRSVLAMPGMPTRVANLAPVNCTLTETKEDAEECRIREALVRNNNNRLKAASELGISRTTLYKKMDRYGLREPFENGSSTEEDTASATDHPVPLVVDEQPPAPE